MDTLIPSEWLEAIPFFFSSMLVKSAIILGVAGVIAFALRFSSASLRHMVLTSAMACILILPFAFLLLPQLQLPLLPAIERVLPQTTSEAPADSPVVNTEAAYSGSSHTFVMVSPDNDVHISVTIPEIEMPPVVADIDIPTVVEIGDFEVSVDVSPVVAPAPAPPSATSPVTSATSAPAMGAASTGLLTTIKSIPWQLALLGVWFTGTLFVLVRLLLAHAGVRLLVRRSDVVDDLDWQYDLDRYARYLGIKQDIKVRHSRLSSVPMIVGCARPVLILPDDHLRWTAERRRIVLLHELAHVKRRDCLTQMIAEVACAFVWFNPMVWLASRQLRIEREIACDDIVLMSGTRASTYAETILETIKTIRQAEWSPVASIAMARKSDLEGRLIAILDPDIRRTRLNKATSSIAVGLIAVMALPVAMAVPVRSAQEAPLPPSDVEDEFEAKVVQSSTWSSDSGAAKWSSNENQSFTFDFQDKRFSENDVAERALSIERAKGSQNWNVSRSSYKDTRESLDKISLERISLDTLSVAQLIKLRRYGVDSRYIAELQELGYDKLAVEELIDLAKYGVDPDYIRELDSGGFARLSVNDLIKFSKYGVDGDLVAGLRAHGYNVSSDEVVELSKFGIDEDDIADYAAAGLANLPVDDLIQMSKYGVDPSDIVEYQRAGYDNLSFDDLIDLSKYGIDADEIAGFSKLGYSSLSVKELIDLSKFGVDADDVAGFVAVGYTDLSVDELVNLSRYGVDSDEIAEMSVIGYDDLTVQDMISLSKYGVDADDIQELTRAGKKFTVEELIDLSKFGVDGDEIAELAAAGYSNLSTDDLVDIARYGVDADEIAEFSQYGYTNLSIDEIVDITKYGVDPELVVALEKLGHKNVPVKQLIKMTKYGIDADYVCELAETEIKLSIDDVIDLGKHGVSAEYIRAMKSDDNN